MIDAESVASVWRSTIGTTGSTGHVFSKCSVPLGNLFDNKNKNNLPLATVLTILLYYRIDAESESRYELIHFSA